MAIFETMKKVLKKSSLLEKTALNVYESIPFGVRNRMLLGPDFVYWTRLLRESEDWDLGRFRDYQFDQVRNLLIHSANNVPYYRKLFSEVGFRPKAMQSLDDLEVLPYLSLAILSGEGGESHIENRKREGLWEERYAAY